MMNVGKGITNDYKRENVGKGITNDYRSGKCGERDYKLWWMWKMWEKRLQMIITVGNVGKGLQMIIRMGNVGKELRNDKGKRKYEKIKDNYIISAGNVEQ